MTRSTHVLIDSADSIVADGAVFEGRAEIAGSATWRVKLRTLRGGKSEGVYVVELDNGAMCIDVLPTRGMGIWRVRRASPLPFREGTGEGSVLGWRAPAREPVHPSFVPLMEPAGLGWLDGFNELLCRCGLESNGPPQFDDAGRLLHPLHGRIANTPASRVELTIDEDAGIIELRGLVHESRFLFQSLKLTSTITTAIGSDEFTWIDEVENIGNRDAMMQMLYHFNIGQPLLQPGARITAPIIAVSPKTQVAAEAGIETWNIMPPPRADSSEQVFVADLAADNDGNTAVLVTGLENNQAVSLRFNKSSLPCFTAWRNTLTDRDGYVLGIEPATNYPNPRSFEQKHGRVVTLRPGEKWRAEVTARWHNDPLSIAETEAAIHRIQADQQPDLLKNPKAEWAS
jgi:hypothetical protein